MDGIRCPRFARAGCLAGLLMAAKRDRCDEPPHRAGRDCARRRVADTGSGSGRDVRRTVEHLTGSAGLTLVHTSRAPARPRVSGASPGSARRKAQHRVRAQGPELLDGPARFLRRQVSGRVVGKMKHDSVRHRRRSVSGAAAPQTGRSRGAAWSSVRAKTVLGGIQPESLRDGPVGPSLKKFAGLAF